MKIPTFLLVLLVGVIPILSFTVLILASTFTVVAWQPPTQWTNQLGAGASSGNQVLFLQVQSDGLYAGGYLGYDLALGGSSTRGLFVTRYDLSGHQKWIDLFGDPSKSLLTGIALGNGGIVAVGHLNGNGKSFLQDYAINGTKVWNSTFSTDPYGDYVESTSGFGSAFYLTRAYGLANQSYVDMLQAYDFNQRLLWNSTIGLDSQGASLLLYASSNGVVAVSSTDIQRGMPILRLFNSTGALVWEHPLDCASCFATGVSGDGSAIYVAGDVASPVNQNNFFLYKYDFAGNKVWFHQFSTDYPAANTIYMSADSSGIYLAVPTSSGGSIMRYDSAWNRVWSFTMRDLPSAVTAGQGGLFIGGTLVTGSYNAFFASLWQSPSLVFLGLNPPFSFVLVAAIGASIVAAVLWLRRHYATLDLSKKPAHLLKGFQATRMVVSDYNK
jgi:hypothetical protein